MILTGADADEKTKRPRSAWKQAATPKTKAAPVPLKTAMARALNKAKKAGTHSYLDTSQVPLVADGSAVAQVKTGLPPTRWEDSPPSPDASQCIDRDAAGSTQGETLNRWVWCQRLRIGIQYFKIIDDEEVYQGTSSAAFHAVTIGNAQQRAVRTYIKAMYGSVEYDDWDLWDRTFTAPGLQMYIGSECAEDDQYCSVAGGVVEHTFEEWDYHREWLHWDIYSNEAASTSIDKVLIHQWHFRVGGSGGGYVGKEKTSDDHTIRCDSANYFSRFGVDYPKACVNYEVIPHLQYFISDPRVTLVADHIRTAQDTPEKTYPIEFEPKQIPGKYTGARDDQGLHRVPDNSLTAKSNEDMKNAACNRQSPYEDWRGLPPYDANTMDCDEYPFASTEEGASSFSWDFSVRAVPASQNRSAGGLLNWYYFSDRILYGDDAFWVEIND